MKNILFTLCCMFCMSALGQSYNVEDTPEVRNWLDNMFLNIDKSKVPYGLLRDYAFELADLDIYNGKELNDSNYVNKVSYENLLRTIRSAVVGTKPFDAEEVLAEQHSLSGRGKGVMGVVLYQYSYIREDALTNHLIRYENEQVFDNEIDGVWQNPYSTGYTLGFSAQDSTLYGSTITYSFPNTIWKSNIISNRVEFDAGDGRGYMLIFKGGSLSVNYASGGVKHLKMRVKLSNGSYLYSHSLVKIISDSQIATRAIEGEAIKPDDTVDFVATSPYNGIIAKGRISYLYASSGEKKIKKPFIVMEGFDPTELVNKNEAYLGDEKYGNTNLSTFVKYLRQRFTAYHKLTSEYDIIYIDLFDCKYSIQANARLFERAIEIINEKKSQDGCTEKNIVFAQSMGGLIARYGLKEMENKSKVHDTSLLFFQDTPHLGAHIPIGILQGMNGLLRFYYENKIFGRLDFGDVKSKLAPILYSDAAKQMLINYVNSNGDVDNSVHNAWQRELSQLGYPQGDNGYKMRIVSISNGQTPVTTIYDPHSYIYVDGNVSTSFLGEFLLKAFSPFMLMPGLVFDDWRIFVLGLLPGSTTLNVHFEANSPSGTSPICYMHLRYIKKFLWIVKIRKTVFSYEKKYPSSMIYYDYMPGSFYTVPGLESGTQDSSEDIMKFLGKYNLKTSFNNRMMFIPTVSSLDIGEGKIALTQSDYEKKYLMDFPPPPPKHTPFDAFYITDGSSYHTSFVPTMLDWMLEQMKVTVDGPKVAMDGSLYMIRNNTKNYAITWSTSDESVATIDDTGRLSMKKHGIITVIASCVINNITTRFYKEIMVGFPPMVLEWFINASYVVTARCIEPDDEPFLKYLQYEWKLKGDHNTDWRLSTVPENIITPYKEAGKLTVYMRTLNEERIKGDVLFISLDATAPYVYYPNGYIDVYGSDKTSDYRLEIFQNPLFENKEDLENNEQFKIASVTATEHLTRFKKDIYFEKPVTYLEIPLKELCKPNYFDDWFRACKWGGTPTLLIDLLFRNKEDKIVTFKILRCEYRSSQR